MVDNLSVSLDGKKARRTGPGVGQNTSVRVAHPAANNINKIKIDNAKTKRNTQMDDDRLPSLEVALAEEKAAQSEWDKVSKAWSDKHDWNIPVSDVEEENFDTARNTLAKAMLKRQQVEAFIEERAALAEWDKVALETLAAEEKNSEYLAIEAKLDKMAEDKSVSDSTYEEAFEERERIVSEDPDIVAVYKKLTDVIDKALKARTRCRELGITDKQLSSNNK